MRFSTSVRPEFWILIIAMMLQCGSFTIAKPVSLTPLRIVVELDVNESKVLELSTGEKVKLTLLEINEISDDVRKAIRSVQVCILVDGQEVNLAVGNYHLPVAVGKIQIDCPVFNGYYNSTSRDPWKLKKDARFRIWNAGSSFLIPETFIYPLKRKWFSDMTQMSNEPVYVSAGEKMENTETNYHSGLDIGGADGMDEVLSATNGIIVSVGDEVLEKYIHLFPGLLDKNSAMLYPRNPRYDVVYVLDERNWLIRYTHLDRIDPALEPGDEIKMGQQIGILGKEGSSGGWSHLHFEMFSYDSTSGEWGCEEAYAYLWEAYMNQFKPAVIAVARPHRLIWAGQEAVLDGSRSECMVGSIASYEWSFSDGNSSEGPIQHRVYEKPGEYSEILKVQDSEGNVDYDFAVVLVFDRENPEKKIPFIHASYYPTRGIRPGDPITFLVRTFNATEGKEVWDFGDGSPLASVQSESITEENKISGEYAIVQHVYVREGHYIAKVERTNEHGYKAVVHLEVEVRLNDDGD